MQAQMEAQEALKERLRNEVDESKKWIAAEQAKVRQLQTANAQLYSPPANVLVVDDNLDNMQDNVDVWQGRDDTIPHEEEYD